MARHTRRPWWHLLLPAFLRPAPEPTPVDCYVTSEWAARQVHTRLAQDPTWDADYALPTVNQGPVGVYANDSRTNLPTGRFDT